MPAIPGRTFYMTFDFAKSISDTTRVCVEKTVKLRGGHFLEMLGDGITYGNNFQGMTSWHRTNGKLNVIEK